MCDINDKVNTPADPARPDGRLRVLHILHGLAPGGVEQLVYEMSLAHLRDMAPAVLCLDHEGPLAHELRARHVPVYHTRRRKGIDLAQIPRIAKIIRSLKPQIIHCHQYTPFFYGALASSCAGTGEILFTEHGRHFPDNVSSQRRLFNRFLMRKAARVTAVCEFTRNCLVRNEGVPAQRIEIIYNGVDVSRFENISDKYQARRRLGLPNDPALIVQVGSFRAVKDQPTAIRAFATAQNANGPAMLAFVGNGSELPRCRLLANSLGLDGSIRFLGLRSDVPEILAAADIMLMTSLSEAHSLSLLEAMASRLPVVATAVGGIPETVVHNQTGLLAPPQDPPALAQCLGTLLRRPQLRAQMGQAGYERVRKRFQRSEMHGRYLEIYRDLARRGAR